MNQDYEVDDDEPDEDQAPINAADASGVRVMREMCKTCIFRPGNLMRLEPGRVAEMVKGSIANDSAITCHSTLYDNGQPLQAVCRGYFDRYADRVYPLRFAIALDMIVEWDLPESAR